MREWIMALSGLLMIAGDIPYIVQVIRGAIKPQKASWIIWTSLDLIALAGLLVKGTLNGQLIGTVTGAIFVTAAVLKFGKAGWTLLDKLCLSGAALGLGLWAAFNDPMLGVLTSLSVIFLGSIPTFVSAWKDPTHESGIAWTLYWLSCLTALAALPSWKMEDSAQPLTFTAIETVMMFILFVRPRLRRS